MAPLRLTTWLVLMIWSLSTPLSSSEVHALPKFKLLTESAQKKKKSFLVVIDPGHGGSDLGAQLKLGKRTLYEKDLTLLLAQSISQSLSKIKIQSVLTREIDKELPLAERTRIANQMGADLFISIHMNSHHHEHKTASIGGFETYILNRTTNEASKRLARLENSVLDGSVADSFENQTDVALIVKDLLLDANLESSKQVACLVQDGIVKASGRYYSTAQRKKRNRGVKQA